MEIGPVDVVILEFPGNKFKGELLPILTDLCATGTIRVLDLVVAMKGDDGTIALLELAGIDENLEPAIAELDIQVGTGLLGDDDLDFISESLAPNSTVALIAWENTWAAPFVAALARADARLVDQVRIPRDVVLETMAAAGITN